MTPAKCPRCERGREVCDYCHDLDDGDWEAICDCGLYDFGVHLIACNIVTAQTDAEKAT